MTVEGKGRKGTGKLVQRWGAIALGSDKGPGVEGDPSRISGAEGPHGGIE